MKRIPATVAIAAIFTITAHGQEFLNLDFESAYNLPANPGNGTLVGVTNSLPDWAPFDGPEALGNFYYVSNSLGDVSSPIELEGGSMALSGDFSIGLYNSGSISQTGTVPSGAESLDFEAQGTGANGSLGGTGFFVTLGGQTLSFSALSQGPDYIVYGANIPVSLDGQTEALVFGCQGIGSGNVLLDNIEFSPSSIPEPGEGGLAGLGAVMFWVFRCRKRKV